jgi:hypothetical protein
VNAYIQASAAQADAHSADLVQLKAAALSNHNGLLGQHPDLAAGTTVTLRVTAHSDKPLDDVTFGLVVHRSTDHFLVFEGGIHRREIGTAASFHGNFCLDFTFTTNLVRGHYAASFYVYDNPTRRWLTPKRRAATFTVSEGKSQRGIAHLDMSATLGSAAPVEAVG